jgi:hypothetical protein
MVNEKLKTAIYGVRGIPSVHNISICSATISTNVDKWLLAAGIRIVRENRAF